ncbi:hypothetical protein PybrP1_006311 [[Pythium] brassicae (nom. inval.)]|nr:hypothetical protein PybrP1_006311 [[Pythium] brassicae (nom. inval.)]
MDDFLMELRALDETQERVEAASDELLRAREEGDDARVRAMIDAWMSALRAGDLHSERVAFLYVANHVLQKTLFDGGAPLAPLFGAHLDEAVSLVSNSPMDRQNVTRLLELWHEKEVSGWVGMALVCARGHTTHTGALLLQIYPDDTILRLWRCTGEDLPSFLLAIAASDTGAGDAAEADDAEQELGLAQLPTLPMKLNAHSANPVIDALKQIDYHKAVLAYLDRTINERHQYVLHHATTTFRTPEDILADRSTTAAQLKRRVEDCLRLVKIRNVRPAAPPSLLSQW